MSLKYEDLLIPEGTSQRIRESLDNLLSTTAMGSVSSAISDTFYGLNHRQQPNSIPINKDYFGLTFFTRPRMNMTTANLRQVRQFAPLLTNNNASIPRAIRAYLDTDSRKNGHSSPVIDDNQAFIPILTNQLISMAGWPDLRLPTHTADPGLYQETFSLADGITFNYERFDLTANFRNIQGDPITTLFLYWCHYASLVFQGILVPYPEEIIDNRIDYQTRIYRLILDPSRKFVQKIAACGAAFPIDVPIGAAFNFESDQPINRANDQIRVTFNCIGAMYQDDILIDEFNRTVAMHNSNMDGDENFRKQNMVKLSAEYFNIFNFKGYPYINPDTYELEWWVTIADYQEILGVYQGEE